MPALRVQVRLFESMINLAGPWLSLHKISAFNFTRM